MTAPLKDHPPVEATSYEIGQDNIQVFGLDIHNPVFLISSLSIVTFVIVALVFPDGTAELFGDLRPWLTDNLDWFFMIVINAFLVFCLYLALSSYGSIRLGGPDAKPEYSYPSWVAMLIAAGIGIGLMFTGVYEPVNHTLQPPLGIAPGSEEASRVGIAATVYHWGIHGWSVYVMVGLSLAFFCFNRGLPLTLRSVFYPILGERVWGWPGHIVDTLAVFATLFGLATSLGYGATQLSAGLDYLFGIEPSNLVRVVLICGITFIALGSVLAGLDAGVKRLSVLNMIMATMLLLFVLFAGQTFGIFERLFAGLGDYFAYMPALSNPIGREDKAFFHGWTTFYWAWWFAWAPFVGTFIARISKGRTVRELVICVLLGPTLLCLVWMTVFGGTALDQIAAGYSGVSEAIANSTPELSLFKLLEGLPWSSAVSGFCIVLIVLFFVTSSDSGSIVIDTITAGGKLDAPVPQRVFWCVFEGLVAIVLLVSGGLGALQAATVSTGLPFGLVMIPMGYCLYRALREERRR